MVGLGVTIVFFTLVIWARVMWKAAFLHTPINYIVKKEDK